MVTTFEVKYLEDGNYKENYIIRSSFHKYQENMRLYFLFLVTIWAHTLCLGLVPSQTRFLERLWEAQTPFSSDCDITIEDESLMPVMTDICKHLRFCAAEGFGKGDASVALAAFAGHVGQTISFNRGENSIRMPYTGENEEKVLRETMLWCRAVISDFSVCPFTIDEYEAGIPKGRIRYTVSKATSIEESFRDFFVEMTAILENSNTDVATVLLMYGHDSLFMNDVELFEAFTACLDNILTYKSLGVEEEMQLVYFHPKFQFRDKDGQNQVLFAEDGTPLGLSSDIVNPIDYSRRAPYPTINILRAPQVNKVQKRCACGANIS